eukprot:348736_1
MNATQILFEIFSIELIQPQITHIESKYVKLAGNRMENIVLSHVALWKDDAVCDDIYKQTSLKIQESCKQLDLIISTICQNSNSEYSMINTNFSSIYNKFCEFKESLSTVRTKLLKMYLIKLQNTYKWNQNRKKRGIHTTEELCDEHKEYSTDCTKCMSTEILVHWSSKCKLDLDKTNIIKYLAENVKEYVDDKKYCTTDVLTNNALIIYESIFNANKDLKAHSFPNLEEIIQKVIKSMPTNKSYKEQREEMSGAERTPFNEALMFYNFIFKGLFIQTSLKSKRIKSMPHLELSNFKIDVHQKNHIFNVNVYGQLQINQNEIQSQFVQLATQAIKESLDKTKAKYFETQVLQRSQQFIKTSESKIQMSSVKRIRAIWYQGINEYHKIKPNQSIQQDHVLALILYTHLTDFCTAFRTTYRKTWFFEPMKDQKQRHSAFANFGRLLYESFVF